MKNRHDDTAGKTKPSKNVRQMNPKTGKTPAMDHNPLHQLFLSELADIFDAEQQLLEELPKMAKAADAVELRNAFQDHLRETEGHVRRLREVATALGEKLKNKRCLAMMGIMDEAQELLNEHRGGPAIDAALIAAAQKVEHYEIASYGTVAAWAREMGHTQAASLLRDTLAEEKAADGKLTEIAKYVANLRAEQED